MVDEPVEGEHIMELNDFILLAAASIRATTLNVKRYEYLLRKEAVEEAKLLWEEVLRQDRER
jgi:hypothetical protein